MPHRRDAKKGDSPTPLTTADLDVLLARLDDLKTEFNTRQDGLKTSLTTEFRTTIASLEAKIDNIQIQISDQGQRLTSLEENASRCSDKIEVLDARCASLEDSYLKLKAKVVDVESRGRRNNIRLIGLPEMIEKDQLSTFFSDLLVEIMGKDLLPEAPELDFVHRALAPRPGPDARPRAVIARVHRYRIKDAIVREARKRRGTLTYLGKPVQIFEDLPQEIVEQRSTYRDVMTALYKRGLKPKLLHPARLFITTTAGRKHLASPREAADFLKKVQDKEPSPSSSTTSD